MPLPVQALVTGRSISVMTGSYVDDFMTAAPTICMSTVEDFVTAAPTSVGDLESSAPTLVRFFVLALWPLWFVTAPTLKISISRTLILPLRKTQN